MGILLAMLLLPYFMTILYVVPSADDFANGLNVLRSIQAEGNRYSAIHKITIDSYMGWQGTWSSIYLDADEYIRNYEDYVKEQCK